MGFNSAFKGLSRALFCALCKWIDDKSRAFVSDAPGSVFTVHRSQVNKHVFEVISYKSFTTLLDETYQTEIALIFSLFDQLTLTV
jgi:hypothetical protein